MGALPEQDSLPQDEKDRENMPPADVQELLGAYALGALDDDERDLVERFIERSPEARAEVARHQAVAEQLGSMAAAAPPTDLWDRINSQVEPERPAASPAPTSLMPASTVVTDLSTERVRRRGGMAWLVTSAAAAIALVLAVALIAQTQRLGDLNETIAAQEISNAQLDNELASREAQIAALNDTVSLQGDQLGQMNTVLTERDGEISNLLASLSEDPIQRAANLAAGDPTSVLINLAAPDTTQPQLTIVLEQDGRGYVTNSDLAPLDPEHTYQLWAIFGDGRVISAAVLGNQPGADTFVVDMDGLEALAVTEEIDGGVVASENAAVAVGSLEA
jgi:anti-sigma-K factor RskA